MRYNRSDGTYIADETARVAYLAQRDMWHRYKEREQQCWEHSGEPVEYPCIVISFPITYRGSQVLHHRFVYLTSFEELERLSWKNPPMYDYKRVKLAGENYKMEWSSSVYQEVEEFIKKEGY
jgi:hypothetical protein